MPEEKDKLESEDEARQAFDAMFRVATEEPDDTPKDTAKADSEKDKAASEKKKKGTSEPEPPEKSDIEKARAELELLAKQREEEEKHARLEQKIEKVAEVVEKKIGEAKPAKGEADDIRESLVRQIVEELGNVKVRDPLENDDNHLSTIKELAESYPQIIEASALIAKLMVDRALNGFSEKTKKIDELLLLMEQEEAWNMLLDELGKPENGGHTDAAEIIESKEFQDWLEKQSDGIKLLADKGTARDKGQILTFYKREVEKGKSTETQQQKKRSEDALHRESIGKRTQPPVGAEAEDEEAFRSLFNSEAQRLAGHWLRSK
ncbi:MAG: hypothetical protein N2255_00125 [Kiritimatiellae bacterium]|nr:hypothetical protein [Kiritimatiellia bacterium]